MYTSKRVWCSAFGLGSPHRMVSVRCGALSVPSWPVRELKPSAQDHTAPECPRHVCTHTRAHRRERCAQCSENMRVHKAWPLMGSSPHCLPLSSPSPPSSFWGTEVCQPKNHHVLALPTGGFQRYGGLTPGMMLPLGRPSGGFPGQCPSVSHSVCEGSKTGSRGISIRRGLRPSFSQPVGSLTHFCARSLKRGPGPGRARQRSPPARPEALGCTAYH